MPGGGLAGDASRGRPRGKARLFKSPLKSILLIAKRYNLDPSLLIEAFVGAWRHNVSRCGRFQIHCRGVDQEAATFLITEKDRVISQFPIRREVLRASDSFKEYVQDVFLPRPREAKRAAKQLKINELKSGMRGVDVRVRVVDVPVRRLVDTRWGGRSYVSNVGVADETGLISLSLWNSQIDRVHIGDEVAVENGYVASFAGELQLRLGRKGTLSVVVDGSN
jgi:replication factor A1